MEKINSPPQGDSEFFFGGKNQQIIYFFYTSSQFAYNGSYLPDSDFIVVMGNLDRFEKNNNTLIFDIKKVEKHRAIFNFSTYEDDIVLVMLNGSVPANHPTVKPIVLNDEAIQNGTICQVTGWGETEDVSLWPSFFGRNIF